jgi:S-adenosylmethionine:diacylglycerol 3-amino-3-carboxypropyl transferase
MNSQLIADAVRDGGANDEATVWDRLYAFWLRRLVYTQIWEDPVADLAALRLAVGSTIVTISSGGCNALSYLMARPAQVYAVDLNEAHLALLKLKIAGLRAFPTTRIFGSFSERPTRRPIQIFTARGCGHCWIHRRAAIGTSAISSAARATLISPTVFTATACSAGSSALPILSRGGSGSIRRCC